MSWGLLGGGHRIEFRHLDDDAELVLILPVAGPRKGARSLDNFLRTRPKLFQSENVSYQVDHFRGYCIAIGP